MAAQRVELLSFSPKHDSQILLHVNRHRWAVDTSGSEPMVVKMKTEEIEMLHLFIEKQSFHSCIYTFIKHYKSPNFSPAADYF